MSFLGVLKTIGIDALKVVNVAAPVAGAFIPIPGAGTAIASLTGLVIAAEDHPALKSKDGTPNGPAKLAWVKDTFNAIYPVLQLYAQMHGETLTLDEKGVEATVEGIVQAFNGVKQVQATAVLFKKKA
jgi:hypothetical protein